MRALPAFIVGLGCISIGTGALAAQATPVPPTYSFTELNSMIAPDMTIKVYRDGNREILLQTRPVSAGSPKGYKGGMYFDFQAHFEYVWDATDGTANCGRQALSEKTAPAMFDVVSGSTELMAELTKTGRTAAGRDTVNGMPAAVFLVSDTVQKATAKLWVADKTNYLVKVTIVTNGAPPGTFLEVKDLSFAKPPASAFNVPATCK